MELAGRALLLSLRKQHPETFRSPQMYQMWRDLHHLVDILRASYEMQRAEDEALAKTCQQWRAMTEKEVDQMLAMVEGGVANAATQTSPLSTKESTEPIPPTAALPMGNSTSEQENSGSQ